MSDGGDWQEARLHERRPIHRDQSLPELSEGRPVNWLAPGGETRDDGSWRRIHTGTDGLVDWSDFCSRPEYRHAIAGTAIEVDQPEWRTIGIGCTGPVAVWLSREGLGATLLASWRRRYLAMWRHRRLAWPARSRRRLSRRTGAGCGPRTWPRR